MRVGMNFALIDEALLVVMKKLDRVLDGDHVLFAFAVDFVQHGSERGGLTGTRRAGDEHEPARLVAEPLDDQRQAQSIKAFDALGLKQLPRKRARFFRPNEKSNSRFSSKRCFWASVSTLYARDFVSAAVSGGMSSGRSFP